MVTISEGAAEAIKGLLAAISPPNRAGMRISGPVQTDGRRYELTPRRDPAPGDETVDQQGIRLFVDPDAARTLEGKVLDARVRRGSLRFAVEDEPR